MAEPLTIKFTMDRSPMPTAEQVSAAMRPSVLSAEKDGDIYEVSFEPAGEDEADSIWLMICEIGAHFPGAVLAE